MVRVGLVVNDSVQPYSRVLLQLGGDYLTTDYANRLYRSSTTYQGNTGGVVWRTYERTRQTGGGGGVWFGTIANRVFNMCLADSHSQWSSSHRLIVTKPLTIRLH